MFQGRQQPGLPFEARKAVDIPREDLGQDLDRNFTAKLRVLGAVDLPHSANAEEASDLERA